MGRIVIALLILLAGSTAASAQLYPTQYRPPDLNWQQLTTPHFKIVYPQGEDSAAWQTGQILELHYQRVRDLTGGSLKNFPVIINNYNDIANGFVTPLHFRSEIQLTPFKGKAINPRSGDWLQAVAPHELVHAMQFSNLGGLGLTRLVSLFSLDLARSMHGAVPHGILEGLAVHHETEEVAPDGGRGNYPYFTNQFDAVFNSSARWSMGQMVQISSYTRPFNRHYIGGYEFTSWLHNSYGRDISQKAIRFYADFPFLGYGVALRHATGEWPNELYEQFESNKLQQLEGTIASEYTPADPLPLPFKGASVHRPKWLSDSSLVFYGSFYNARPGFYRYDLATGELSSIVVTGIVSDYAYDLSQDKSRLVYSYYESSPVYDNTFKSELVEVDVQHQSSRQLTHDRRLYGPVYNGNTLLALQTDHASSRLVRFSPQRDSVVETVASVDGVEIVAVAASPLNTTRLAVVANKGGTQALWVGTTADIEGRLRKKPVVFFSQGSVFDPVWHPDGDRILFSSDASGTLNLYEYDLASDSLIQLTHSRYNAFEGSYSPDGNAIAFIMQHGNQQLPAVLNREDFYNLAVRTSPWETAGSNPDEPSPYISYEAADTVGLNWHSAPYSTGIDWLKPRTFIPIVEEVSNRDVYKVGAAVHSNDLLQQQSYSAELTFLQDRLWYDITYNNTSFYPGFEATAYSRPSYSNMAFDVSVDTLYKTMLRQERGLSLAVPLRYRFERNVYHSSLLVRPKIRQSQIRYFELDRSGGAASDFADVTIANLYVSFSYRLQQNIRDVQPNSGLVLFTELEHYLWPTGLTINTLNAQFSRSFTNAFAVRGGMYAFASPLRRLNQSLRVDLLFVRQNDFLFDNQFLISEGFSEPVFPFSRNLMSVGTRYTIPIWYPDRGGFLLPGYLSNVYLVAFTNTVGKYTQPYFLSSSRTVLGAGLRVKFRLSNLSFDLGIGIGFEPGRNRTTVFVGNF